MKRKQRGRPKKAVAKKPTPAAAAEAAAVAATATATAQTPPPVNADEEVFLNFVEKNVDENCVSNEVDNNGLGQYDAAKEFSSSPSPSSSSEDEGSDRIREDNGWSDERAAGGGVSKSSNKRGRLPMRWEASKKAANTPVISLRGVGSTVISSRGVGSSAMSAKGKRSKVGSSKGFSSMSRKELPKKPSDDPRYNKAELQACLGVIKKIMEMEEAVSFCSPVDPIAQGIPDYFSVIDTPMDFGTIYNNLQNDVKYLNSDDVYKDVDYIWENCSKYNKKGDYIVYLMKRVKKKFMKYWTGAGLRTEMQRKHDGHSHLAPPSVHAMRQSGHEAMSVVDNMVNSYQMQQDKFGTSQPRPQAHPSYAHPYQSHQPQPSTSLMPQYSQMHAGPGSSYTGHSYMPGPPPLAVHPMEQEKQAFSHPMPPMRSGPAHSHQQQPQLSSRYMWNSHQTTSQAQPSQSHFHTDINNTGHQQSRHQQSLHPTDYAATHNGYAPRSSMEPMHSSMGHPQPQHQFMSHYQQNESNQPQTSMGPPQPSRPAASVDISSPAMALVDSSRRETRHMKRNTTGPADEVHVVCALPQQPLVGTQMQPSSLQGSTPETKRGGRGPTRCRFMSDLREGERIFIPINTLGQPIGPEAPKLASFLGTLARDGKMAPLNYLDWSAMPEAIKENMWTFVQTKFDIDPLCKNWFLKSIASKWRNWKAKLKADHYNPHATDEERLRDCNKRIYPDQWAALVAHWNDEAVQLRAMKNKANRAKQKSAHASGSKSFARIREEEQAKRPDGKELTRSELYILTRTRKDGQPVDDIAAEAIRKLREHEKRKEEQASDQSSDEADTFCEVMGEETTHVRMYGCGGPTPGDLYGRKPSRTSLMRVALEAKRSANEEVGKMLGKMEAMEEKYTSLEAQIVKMNSNMQILIDKMAGVSGSKQALPKNPPEDSLQAQLHSSSSSHALEGEYEEEAEADAGAEGEAEA